VASHRYILQRNTEIEPNRRDSASSIHRSLQAPQALLEIKLLLGEIDTRNVGLIDTMSIPPPLQNARARSSAIVDGRNGNRKAGLVGWNGVTVGSVVAPAFQRRKLGTRLIVHYVHVCNAGMGGTNVDFDIDIGTRTPVLNGTTTLKLSAFAKIHLARSRVVIGSLVLQGALDVAVFVRGEGVVDSLTASGFHQGARLACRRGGDHTVSNHSLDHSKGESNKSGRVHYEWAGWRKRN